MVWHFFFLLLLVLSPSCVGRLGIVRGEGLPLVSCQVGFEPPPAAAPAGFDFVTWRSALVAALQAASISSIDGRFELGDPPPAAGDPATTTTRFAFWIRDGAGDSSGTVADVLIAIATNTNDPLHAVWTNQTGSLRITPQSAYRVPAPSESSSGGGWTPPGPFAGLSVAIFIVLMVGIVCGGIALVGLVGAGIFIVVRKIRARPKSVGWY